MKKTNIFCILGMVILGIFLFTNFAFADSVSYRICKYKDSGLLFTYRDLSFKDEKAYVAPTLTSRELLMEIADECPENIDPIEGYDTTKEITISSVEENDEDCWMNTIKGAITYEEWEEQQKEENNDEEIIEETEKKVNILETENEEISSNDEIEKSELESKIVEIQKQIIELLKLLIEQLSNKTAS